MAALDNRLYGGAGKEFPALSAAPTTDDIHRAIKKGSWRGSKSTLESLKILFEMRHIEQFNFGPLSLDAIREVQKEALEFMQYGCFSLPYDEVIFRCAIEFENRTVGFHIYSVNRRRREGPPCIASLGSIQSLDSILTFRSDNMLKAFEHPTLGTAMEITIPKSEIAFWENHIGTIGAGPYISDQNGEILTEGSLIAMGLVMILNTKGVLKERSAPPAKPNKVRIAQGRPALPYVTKVYTSVYNRAIERGPQGTHASPRPHRRRAHIRHYPKTETREAYSVKIAAMLVNWDGQPLPERKEYEVKHD